MKGTGLKRFFKKINETINKIIRQKGLGFTIFSWFLILSLVPLLIASIISFMSASEILRQDAVNALNTESQLKQEFINNWFDERAKGIRLLSQLSTNVTFLKDFNTKLRASGKTAENYIYETNLDMTVCFTFLDLDNFRRSYGYQDIYLIDPDGTIVMSIIDQKLGSQNIFTHELFANSQFSKVCARAMKSNEPFFSDIEYLSKDKDEAFSFLIQSMQIEDKKERVGLMAIRLSMTQIDEVMKSKKELMKGELFNNKLTRTYLIGEDKRFRSNLTEKSSETIGKSDSKFEEKMGSDVKNIIVDTHLSNQWLDEVKKAKASKNRILSEGDEGAPAAKFKKVQMEKSKPTISESYLDYNKKKVLGVYYRLESLENLGGYWGLIAEINEDDAFKSANSLRMIVIILVLGTIILVSVISIFAARKIVEPILKLSNWAQQVAIGDLRYNEIPMQNNEIGQTSNSFKKVVDSFQAVASVCETIALGDFTKTVDIRSEEDMLGKAVNQMRDNLVEVVQQANNISLGDYSNKVVPKSEKDMLGIALERMTRTLRDAAMVAEEVSVGDYSLEVEIKGDKDMLGKALNQMIVRLRESNADSQKKIDYLNNIPTPVHVIDSNYTIRFINKSGASLVGKTVDECIGKKCYTLFNTAHCQSERCRANRAMNQNKVLTGETIAHLPTREIPMRYTSAPLKDMYGEIIGAIEYMVDISDEMLVVELAEKISQGDYSVKIQKRSEEDRLSDALNRMTQSLRFAVEENKRQNWLKTGQTELNNRMRGELDIPELAQSIISFLTTYLDAQVGLLYFTYKSDMMKLVGSYALGRERVPLRKFKLGEGIVGQAALENRLIEITQIPKDFIKIRTGFGEITPQYVIAVPFSYEGTVIGVIEIASLYRINEIQKEFLLQSLENIGISLNSAESRRQLTELLQKTQEQAERLQQQQEELRQSNEELEGQTRALIASETNLQSQQEELRVINEELEERTKALEKQKTDIQHKNMELMLARNEIEKKARDIEEVSKYKSEFLANMSHELRTPLNSILILSQLLSNNSDKNLSDKQVEFAKTIHSSGSDLLELINEILDLSKIEAGMMEIRIDTVALSEIAGNLERIFKPIAQQKGIEFLVNYSKNELPESVNTDSQRVMQILKNLLSNAFKFTDKGGVTLSIYRPPKEITFNNPALSRESSIAISVSDTGIGIPKDKQSLIFEAFRQEDGTTSRKYGGTGLGLSISRELSGLLGGEIHLESEKGSGSTFTIYIPEKLEKPGKRVPIEVRRKPHAISQETAPGAEPNIKPELPTVSDATTDASSYITAPSIDQSTYNFNKFLSRKEIKDDRKTLKSEDKSILIIEDDTHFAELLLSLAKSKGFKGLIAEDGETGLHFADFYKPSAIILDVKLPKMDGWQVMDRLKNNPETRHIPVHFMSGLEISTEAMSKGAIGYLKKPISTESLETAFKKIEKVISKPLSRILILDSDETQKESIVKMINSNEIVEATAVKKGVEALDLLKRESFDSMIMSLELSDMNSFDLLEEISSNETISQVPIIVYSEKELNPTDQELLRKFAQRIIIKNVQSIEALFAETTLFLHRVENDHPELKQRMLNLMIDKEAVMKGKKILIVDDDMRNVFALTSILEEKNMKTVVGKNGQEGIERLNAEPDIDLVLMDIMMPVMDGYEAMKTIRRDKRFEKLPIIALTAKAMKGDRNKCVVAGANDYLAKPVDPAKLLSLLRVWLYD